jgi:hypothetical protein
MKIQAPVPFMLAAAIAVLVGGLTTIELLCPVCDGKGFLEGAPGLKVESVESELLGENQLTSLDCGDITIRDKYKYEVNISLTNEGTEPSKGTMVVLFFPVFGQERLVLGALGVLEVLEQETQIIETDLADPHDPKEEIPIVVPIYVSVPAGTTKNIKRVLSFERESGSLAGSLVESYRVEAAGLHEDIPCTQCGGMKENGKLPLLEWLQQTILQ